MPETVNRELCMPEMFLLAPMTGISNNKTLCLHRGQSWGKVDTEGKYLSLWISIRLGSLKKANPHDVMSVPTEMGVFMGVSTMFMGTGKSITWHHLKPQDC